MQQYGKYRKPNVLIGIISIGLVVLACVSVAALIVLRSPLAGSLKIAGKAPAPALPTAVAGKAVSVTPTLKVTSLPPASTPTSAASKTCLSSGTLTLLFNGTGVANGKTSADAIRMIKIDYDAPSVKIIAFPRDLWVRTDTLQALNMPESRLGDAFHYQQNATQGSMRDKYIAGTTVVAQALYDNFDIQPQHYMTVNLLAWGKMVDAIGGVEVTLPDEVHTANGLIFSPGKQTLDGARSVEYIRTMAMGGEDARLQRQNLYVKALQERVLSGQIIPRIPAVLSQFNDVIVTDLSPAQLLDLACIAEKVPPSQVTYYEIGGDLVQQDSQGQLLPNADGIKNLANQVLSQ